ncbi:Cytochrome c [Maioricimonas rarisocia]|uniref:Cytochrome c n=1 Tax=Maioricimonas rarisocia TaxID=2528026 RepID=A0A517Z4U1_9PLAN|nr:di-heme oxidoredictase family protein [Maioricimonas rarisocia]QDU37512.1 Cytochrome c [Maioricimonas rarisocia]
MNTLATNRSRSFVPAGWCLAAVALAAILCWSGAAIADKPATEDAAQNPAQQEVSGREIFLREWMVNDSRSHGGDGLGPVFNDTSCIACHNQGGAGGGGPASKNVEILSATSHSGPRMVVPQQPTPGEQFVRSMFGLQEQQRQFDSEVIRRRQEAARKHLAKIHPGFQSAGSVVLHRFGIDPKYATWRQQLINGHGHVQHFNAVTNVAAVDMLVDGPQTAEAQPESDLQKLQRATQEIQRIRSELGQVQFTKTSFVDGATLTLTERNAISLFGAGLIDSIPDVAIEAAANAKHEGFPEISGRVSRLKDGRIGRFGWKAQKATLYDFTMTACAVELGLHVPDHPQAGTPLDPEYRTASFDLNQDECNALVDYLKNLPAPEMTPPANDNHAEYLAGGQKLFASVGCATCHTEQMGDVVGVYSDLLVHDMGNDLVDTGDYGSFTPTPDTAEDFIEEVAEADEGDQSRLSGIRVVGATRQEWRTAPLWGVRDSAPYLHDGRAETLEQAIAFHGGESAGSAQKYFMLTSEERQQVLAFLRSLTAPSPDRLASAR